MADMTKGIYRRIYSGAIRGKRINGISIQAEFWFWRVHMICDDFGSFEADPYICRVSAAPRRRTIKDSDVRKWLGELQSAGLIRLYDVDGERFGTIVEWEKWQPAGRNGRRVQKYPGESEGIPGNPENPNPSGTSHLHPHLHPHPQARGDRNPPGKSRPSWTEEDVDAIYDAYPRHVAPLKAKEAIRKALAKVDQDGIDGDQTPAGWLLVRTKKYAAAWKGKETMRDGRDIRPYPATWFNQGRYDDDEAEWKRA